MKTNPGPSLLFAAAALILPLAAHATVVAVDGAISENMDAGGTSENLAEYILGNAGAYNRNITHSSVSFGRENSWNSFTIQNGSKFTTGNTSTDFTYVYIGQTETSNDNNVLVTGNGSAWNMLAKGHIDSGGLFRTMHLGARGSRNSLTIENGGSVSNSHFYIGYGDALTPALGNHNTARITGNNSVLNTFSSFVGSRGSNNALIVEDGGAFHSSSALMIGRGDSENAVSGSNNTIEVDGFGSILSTGNTFTVGDWGSHNTVTISDHALAKAGALAFSVSGGTDNYIRLDGVYLALKGNQTTELAGFIAAERFQLWDETSGTWLKGELNDFIITYHATGESAEGATGYAGLANYTTITTIPEPGTWGLLLGAAAVVTAFRKRRPAGLRPVR